MTIASNDRRKTYAGNGVTTVFNGPRAFSASHIQVSLVDDDTGVATAQTGGDYTLTGVGRATTVVTMNVAPPLGTTLLILRTVPYTQETDIKNQGAFLPEIHEDAFDSQVMQTQQLADGVERSFRLPEHITGVNTELPVPSPLSPLVWSSDGDALENGSTTLTGDMLLRPNLAATDAGKGADLVAFRQAVGASARSVAQKLQESLSLLDFIPVAEHAAIAARTSTYDCTSAIQAGISEAQARKCDLYAPAGRYRYTGTIDAHAYQPYSIIGDGSTQTTFYADFGGASAVGFRFTHPTTPATRNKQYVLSRVGFIQSDAFNPGVILVEHRYCTDAKWDNVYIQSYQNNSGLVLSDIFNADFYEVSVWGCGAQRCLRDINALTTASIASGATTLTASASTFAAGDVGKYVVLDGLAPQVFLISGYTSATQVTVSSPARATFTNVRMDFCSSRGSMTSASATLTMDGNVLTVADIGRTVYVLGAGASTGGSGRLPLRATITGVSAANTCTLSVAASTNVTDALVVISPAVDVFSDAGGTNDVYINGLQIEEHRGVGLVLDTCINTYFDALKVHSTGVPTGGINGASSQANMLVVNSSIHAAGNFEQRVGNHLGRVIAVCSPSSGNHFADFSTIAQYGMGLIHAMGGTFWSKITVGNVVCQNQADSDFVRQWLTSDASTNGFHHYGTFSSYRQVSTNPGATAQFGAIKSCGARVPLTMNDDEARSFKVSTDTQAGCLLLFSDTTAGAALVAYSFAGGTARCAIVAQPSGALFEASTSALTGATGNDTKITVSCTTDGTLYVENRSGSYKQFWFANFS